MGSRDSARILERVRRPIGTAQTANGGMMMLMPETNVTKATYSAREDAMRYLHAHDFLRHLKANQRYLTRHQLATLRGQALSRDVEGATKGLWSILNRG